MDGSSSSTRDQRTSSYSQSSDNKNSANHDLNVNYNRSRNSRRPNSSSFSSTNQIMRGHELMKDFSRGTYADWKDYLVDATHDKVSKGGEDITSCLRETKDVKIELDLSLKPTPAQHVDPTTQVVTYDEVDTMMKDDWDKHVTKIEKRQAVYKHNKLTVCSIVKGSIDPHFKDKLRSKSEYETKQDDLVWLLVTIKALCNFGEEEKEPTLDVVESQICFLSYKQKDTQDLLSYKQAFRFIKGTQYAAWGCQVAD